MIRLMSVAAVLLSAMASASAGPILTIVGTPASYTPGGSFSVTVLIEDVTDFASFSLDLMLSSSSGVAGTDFGFTPAVLAPSSPDYVFDGNQFPLLLGDPGLFLQTPSTDGSNNAFLSVSDAFDLDGDFVTDGVTVASGAPKLLAEATIFTTSGAGDLVLEIGGNTILFSSDNLGGGSPITGGTFVGGGSIPSDAALIPEPSSVITFCLGLIGLSLRHRRRSEAAA